MIIVLFSFALYDITRVLRSMTFVPALLSTVGFAAFRGTIVNLILDLYSQTCHHLEEELPHKPKNRRQNGCDYTFENFSVFKPRQRHPRCFILTSAINDPIYILTSAINDPIYILITAINDPIYILISAINDPIYILITAINDPYFCPLKQ